MNKLSYENKIEIYNKYKEGHSLLKLSKEYYKSYTNIRYMVKIIELHGIDIVRTNKNKVYSKELKEKLVLEALNGTKSIFDIAAEAGLVSRTLLQGWISKYKENEYNIVERKRGRPTMNKKLKEIKKNETIEEENERLKKENEYLKAELEYSKKLKAVVQSRKNLQQKKK